MAAAEAVFATMRGTSRPAASAPPLEHGSQCIVTSSSMQALASKIDLKDLEFCKDRMGNVVTLGEGGFGQVIYRPRPLSVGP